MENSAKLTDHLEWQNKNKNKKKIGDTAQQFIGTYRSNMNPS